MILTKISYFFAVFVKEKICKDPKLVKAEDFIFSVINIDIPRKSSVGSFPRPVYVEKVPGLDTLGISFIQTVYAPNGGLFPSHTNPLATEILVVLKGTLYVGFVTSDSRVITEVLHKGRIFVFPAGLFHFQFNVGKTTAVSMSVLSRFPGFINPDVLSKAFKPDKV